MLLERSSSQFQRNLFHLDTVNMFKVEKRIHLIRNNSISSLERDQSFLRQPTKDLSKMKVVESWEVDNIRQCEPHLFCLSFHTISITEREDFPHKSPILITPAAHKST